MKELYGACDIAVVLNISDRAVRKRSEIDKWPFQVIKSRGCAGKKLFPFASLPENIQLAIQLYEAGLSRAAQSGNGDGANGPSSTVPATSQTQIQASAPEAGLTQAEIEETLLMGRLVSLYREHYLKSAGKWGKLGPAKEEFVRAYNLGEHGSYPDIHKVLKSTSVKSLDRWDLKLSRNGNDPLVLADRRGTHNRGQRTLAPEQERTLRACALSPNQPLLAEVIRQAKAKWNVTGMPCTQSDDTLRRWLNDYKKAYYTEWVLYRQGEKALNDKCVYHIRRDMDRIEVGDVVFADGHVLNWKILNPWTGKAQRMTLIAWYDMKSNAVLGWDIMPSENTQAIVTALYRACLCLGKIPKVPYLDNGKAFAGRFFTGRDLEQDGFVGLFERLGMRPTFAWHYHAESKPVEGLFKIFAELERMAPSYCGNNIENKPAYLKRNEKLHKALHELLTGGRVPTMEESHAAIASWLDDYHGRPQTGHLKGKCPHEELDAGKGPGFTPEEQKGLRLLMSHQVVKKIHRDGIKMPWGDERYYHPDLYGRQLQSAIVRYDWLDRSVIHVYDLQNNYICTASRMAAVHPAARQLGDEADVAELQRQIELKRGLVKQTTTGPAKKFWEEHILPEVRLQMEQAGFEGGELPASASATASKGERGQVKQIPEKPITEKEKEAAERGYKEMVRRHEEEEKLRAGTEAIEASIVVELPEPEREPEPSIWEQLPRMSNLDRYERLLELEAKRESITSNEQSWMSFFERSAEYAKHREYFEQYREKMALLYQ